VVSFPLPTVSWKRDGMRLATWLLPQNWTWNVSVQSLQCTTTYLSMAYCYVATMLFEACLLCELDMVVNIVSALVST
jgi:hypothetical protein